MKYGSRLQQEFPNSETWNSEFDFELFFFGILLENDPAPIQGTAKAIPLRPPATPVPTATT